MIKKITYQRLKKALKIIFTFNTKLIKALFKGTAACIEHKSFLLNLNQLNSVVDIGCNKGQFALIAKYCYPNTTIHSFDPLCVAKKEYQKILNQKDNCFFYPYAIGPENKSSIINISESDDSSSLLTITKKQTDLYPGTSKMGEQKIDIRKLSKCLQVENIKSPSLLKIDVQGFELDCLRGVDDYLNLFEYIYVECSYVTLYENQALAPDVIKWLENRNYKFINKYNSSYDDKNNLIQADLFFRKH